MKRTLLTSAAVLTVALLGVLSVRSLAERGVKYKVGDAIPDFALKDDAGHTVHLAQFKGKVVVLNFYATWCPDCNAEAPHMEREVWEKYRNKNVEVLGIAVQEGDKYAENTRKFRKEHGVTYPLLLDEPGDILQKFGFVGIPQGIILDTNGKYVSAPDKIDGFVATLKKLVK